MNSPATRTSRASIIVVILALLAVGVVVFNAPFSDDRGAQAYVVQPGDDYYTISSVLGSGDVAAGAAYLARANGELPAAPLRPGRVLLFEPSEIDEIVVDPTGVDATTTVPRAAQDRPELLAGAAVERVEVNGVMQTWDEATSCVRGGGWPADHDRPSVLARLPEHVRRGRGVRRRHRGSRPLHLREG